MLILLVHQLITVNAIIGRTSVNLSPGDCDSFLWFGFYEGGNLLLNFDVSSDASSLSMSFYLCTPGQYDRMSSIFDLKYCQKNQTKNFQCDWEQTITSASNIESGSYQKVISDSVTYNFVLASCGPGNINAEITYEITNPGGEQLSVGVLEIKYLMIGFMAAWDLLILLWLVKWIFIKAKKPNISQLVLIINCLLWATFSITFYNFMHLYSVEGTPNSLLLNVSIALLIASEICFFGASQVISAGLGVRKNSFHRFSWCKVLINVFLLIFCYLLFLVIGSTSFYILAGIYVLLLIIYLCDIKNNITDIVKDMQKMIENGQEIIESQEWHQIRMYRILSIAFTLFFFGLAVISAVNSYYYYMPWIGVGAHIYVIFNCSLILCSYFRFQENSPYTISQGVLNRL